MRLGDIDEIRNSIDRSYEIPESVADAPLNKGILLMKKKALETIDSAETIVEIPIYPTNGDMIKAMFPSTKSRLDEKTGIVLVKWVDGTMKTFKASWWNARYKGASK